MTHTEIASVDKRFKTHRLMSTIAAAGMMLTTSTSAGAGFMIVPGMARFHVGAGQYLLFFSIFTLAAAATNMLSGSLMTRYGVRIVSIIGSIGVFLSYVGIALSPNVMVFYVFAGILGTAWTGCTLLASSYLTTAWHNHSRRGSVVGIVAMGGAVGGIVWGLAIPAVVSAGGFTSGFLALAGAVLVFGVIPAIFLVRNPPISDADHDVVEREGRPNNRSLWGGFIGITVFLGLAFFVFALESSFGVIQPAVYDSFGIDPVQAGLLVSLYSVCGLIAKPILGYLFDKLGVRTLFITLTVLYILGLPGIAFFGQTANGMILILLPLASLSLAVPTIILPLVTAQAVGNARFPMIYGTILTTFGIGLAISTPLWGFSFDATGSYDLAMYSAGLLGVLGVVLAYIASSLGRRKVRDLETITKDSVDTGLVSRPISLDSNRDPV